MLHIGGLQNNEAVQYLNYHVQVRFVTVLYGYIWTVRWAHSCKGIVVEDMNK